MFAMHLMSSEREAPEAVLSFDEGLAPARGSVGRTLLSSLQRMGRSERAVPIISTQLVTDALVENTVRSPICSARRSCSACAPRRKPAALALLDLDPEDRRMRRSLLGRAGSCLMRDHRGRVEASGRPRRSRAPAGPVDDSRDRLRRASARGRLLRSSAAALVVVPVALLAAPGALGAPPHGSAPHGRAARAHARQPGTARTRGAGPARAPSGPALSVSPGTAAQAEEATSASTRTTADPLVSNGLGSPLCGARESKRSCRRRRAGTASRPASWRAPHPPPTTGLTSTSMRAFSVSVTEG
jgi:hypothetical protein